MAVGRLRLKHEGYDFPPYRPPSEAQSLLLRVTRGCPWNKCLFCSMYKGIPFERRTVEEITRDIEAASALCRGVTQSIFIGDSNSLVIKTDTLVMILRALHKAFPDVERVTSYARAKTIAKKDTMQLQQIREAGLVRLHVGLETGDAATLKFIKKGATPQEMVEAGLKTKEAGFELSLYVLLGIGGAERWQEHADGTIAVLNAIDPHFIRVRTLVPQPGSPLFEMRQKGVFALPSPDVILAEERRIIAGLDVTSEFLSDHISNYLSLNGTMPRDKLVLVKYLDREVSRVQEDPVLLEIYRQRESLCTSIRKYCGVSY